MLTNLLALYFVELRFGNNTTNSSRLRISHCEFLNAQYFLENFLAFLVIDLPDGTPGNIIRVECGVEEKLPSASLFCIDVIRVWRCRWVLKLVSKLVEGRCEDFAQDCLIPTLVDMTDE